jgi:hypothetical protein
LHEAGRQKCRGYESYCAAIDRSLGHVVLASGFRLIKHLYSRLVPIGGMTSRVDGSDQDRTPTMRVVRDELAREIHIEPHLHSDCVTHGIDARSLWSNIEASVIQQGMHPCSRGASSPSLFRMDHPPDDRGRREDRELASPMARLQQKTQAAGTTGSAEGIPTFPARWCYDLYALFPGTGCLAPVVSRRCGSIIAKLGISSGMPEPHDFIVAPDRSSAREPPRCDPTRPPHPAPDVRDDREAPPQRDGMRRVKHVF